MSKRKAIPLEQQLASALACLLPQDKRDELRRAKVPAKDVIRLFSQDHIGLYCFKAPDRDEWHNLTPILRAAHAEKSKRDTSIAAKVARLRAGSRISRSKIVQRKNPWPPKGSRSFGRLTAT
jgi:hypothetical protein